MGLEVSSVIIICDTIMNDGIRYSALAFGLSYTF